MDWFLASAMGFNVQIEDETDRVAALAFQGPTSCAVLKKMGFQGIENLKPYRFTSFPFESMELMISRTGFTGDLGYELWCNPEQAETLWDVLMEAGRNYGIRPFGAEALGMTRIEAGFIQAGVEFVPALDVVRTQRSRSPYELGLGWLVHLKKPNFNGRKSLIAEKEKGSRYRFVRLIVEGNKPAEHAVSIPELEHSDRPRKVFASAVKALAETDARANRCHLRDRGRRAELNAQGRRSDFVQVRTSVCSELSVQPEGRVEKELGQRAKQPVRAQAKRVL